MNCSHLRFIPLLVTAAFISSVATGDFVAAGEPADGELVSQQLSQDLVTPLKLDYLLYLPKDYEQDESKKWPLVLFLHGAGERGDDLDRVKIHGPPKLAAAGKEFPFIFTAPQCKRGRVWEPDPLMALLDDLESRYRVDADRIYVTGLSMGGYGSWQLGTLFPQRFAAIVPICGGGDAAVAGRMMNLPVWAFHGAKDTAVSLGKSQSMIKALQKAGNDAKLTVYPEAGHDSWTETYNNPEVYNWLLSQKRAARN